MQERDTAHHIAPSDPRWLQHLERRCSAQLPGAVYDWIAGGAGREDTLAANASAWREVLLRPDALLDVSRVDTSTTILGSPVASPIAVAPCGFHGLANPGAEIATAQGCRSAGALFALSSRSSLRIEDIATHCGTWWYQPYILRDRSVTEAMVKRATGAGARALVLTVDAPILGTRRRNRDGSLISKEAMEVNTGAVEDPALLEQSPCVIPEDISWLSEMSGLPVVVKGVLRSDTARRCVDAGAAAIWVSNHGGRQLDGCLPTAVALPEVRAALGHDVEVYVDGGISSGTDVLRALALGARAVFVGRAPVWGLVEAGPSGVQAVLAALQAELTAGMQLSGRITVNEIGPDLVARQYSRV